MRELCAGIACAHPQLSRLPCTRTHARIFPHLQLVWAKSAYVGCAAFRCEELAGAEDVDENGLLMVCYYGPG